MKNISERYRNTSGFGFDLRLEAVIEGQQRVLTYDDLLSYKKIGNASSADVLSFGYASGTEISFSIDNLSEKWSGTSFKDVKWTLFTGKVLSHDESEMFQTGIFTTSEALDGDGAINITATDNMSKFDVKFKGINFPCTLLELLAQCCAQAGVTLKPTVFPNQDFVLTGAYQLTQITCRTIVSLIAELAGCFATINAFGELELKWFDTRNPVYQIQPDNITEFSPDTIENVVGGVSIIFNGTEIAYGSGVKKINLTEDNRLLMYCSQEQIHELLINIYNARQNSLVFSTAKLQSIGEPALELGDVIEVTDRKGIKYKLLVSLLTLSGNLKMDIESPPLTSEEESSSSSTDTGSIPRESVDAVSVYVSKNNPLTLASETKVEQFLYQNFSTSTGALPLVMLTLTGECTKPGILKVHFILDNSVFQTFHISINQGYYVNTIVCPLQNLVSGNHSVEVQLESSFGLEFIFPVEDESTPGSTMVVQGSKMSSATSWDGMINCNDAFKSPRVARNDLSFKMKDTFNTIETNDSGGPIICQTISINVNRGDAKLSNFSESIETNF